MTTTTTRRLTSALAALLTAGALTTAGSAGSPKFLNDDPVWHEPDTQDASGIKADEVNLFVDHSQIVQLECLRSGIWGTKSLWGRVLTYKG